MSIEQNKALALRPHEEVFNQGNLAAANEIFDADYTWYGPGLPPDLPRGPEGVKRFASMLRSAFPDVHFAIDDALAEGDQVMNRWTMRGTHLGTFQGVSPTGAQVTVTGIDVFRISGDKIVENRQEVDFLGMLQQIGAIPTPVHAHH